MDTPVTCPFGLLRFRRHRNYPETLGHSLLTQFEGTRLRFRQARIPFVDTPEKAHRR